MSSKTIKTAKEQSPKGVTLRQSRTGSSSFRTLLLPEQLPKAPWNPRLEFKLTLGKSDLLDAEDNSEHHRVSLEIEVIAKTPLAEESQQSSETKEQQEASKIFIVSIQQEGIFSIVGLDKSQKNLALNTICLETLFPYLSTRISEMVLHAGYPPVYLQPMNFVEIYKQKLQKEQEQVAKQKAELEVAK